jgi:hypothetical protein
LFDIKIVANSFFGLDKSEINKLSFFELDSLALSISCGDKEKKATSDPEISADKTNNPMNATILIIETTGRLLNISIKL